MASVHFSHGGPRQQPCPLSLAAGAGPSDNGLIVVRSADAADGDIPGVTLGADFGSAEHFALIICAVILCSASACCCKHAQYEVERH